MLHVILSAETKAAKKYLIYLLSLHSNGRNRIFYLILAFECYPSFVVASVNLNKLNKLIFATNALLMVLQTTITYKVNLTGKISALSE